MKFIRILIVAILLISTIPWEAFCHDEHCVDAPVACAVSCPHAVNLNAVLLALPISIQVAESSEAFSSDQTTYQNPVILSLKKPPIVLS